jgi:hypothetical protein
MVAALTMKTACMSATSTDTFFDGCNVHVRSGAGATDATPNGLGNLIVGYNEAKLPLETKCGGTVFGAPCTSDDDCTGEQCLPAAQTGSCDTGPLGAVCFSDAECLDDGTCVFELGETAKTGSHNLVIGTQHEYTSYAGIVSGQRSRIVAPYATITGGRKHNVIGMFGSILGGSLNNASGEQSSVCGGAGNWSRGSRASILGGSLNQAGGTNATVSGGDSNIASERASSVSGGRFRTAAGDFDWVAGTLLEND